MRSKSIFSLSALSCILLVTGCALTQSPAVGDWSGKMTASPGGGMGAMVGGMAAAMLGDSPAELSLKADGTGYLKIPSAPERPITWKMDGERVLLDIPGDSSGASSSSEAGSGVVSGGSGSQKTASGSIIGKLSEDKKTLTFDLGPIQFAMTKQAK